MTTHTVALPHEREARVTIDEPHAYGSNVSSVIFDKSAQIIAQTPTTTYFDYCDAEIVYREIAAMFDEPDYDAIFDAIESADLLCACSDDEEIAA